MDWGTIAGPARRTGRADDGQGDVLGRHTRPQGPSDLDLHVLALALDQRLGGQHMLDLRRADPMRERAEGAVGRGVAVTANDRHPRQSPALFGPDDVDDALPHIRHRVIVDAKIPGVLVERGDLDAAVFRHRGRIGAVQRRRHVVVRHGDGLFGRAHLAVRHAQTFKGLGAGHFVDQMAVDIQKAGAIFGLMDDVIVPDLVIECTRSHGSHLFIGWLGKGVWSPGAGSAAGKDTAGHAEETGRKPRMIGDVEVDEPVHAGRYTLEMPVKQATSLSWKGFRHA